MKKRTILGLAGLVCVLVFGSCADPGPLERDPSIEAEADQRAVDSALLRDRLSSGTADERLRAAQAIGRIQSPRYIEALAEAVADPEPSVGHAALFALGQLGLVQDRSVDPRAADAVRPLLQAGEGETVAAALAALGKLGDVETAEEIAPFLAHDDPDVRSEAALALFRLRFAPLWRGESDEPPTLPDVAVDGLTGAMSDPEPDVKFAATYAFSRYGDPRARSALVAAATDADTRVRLFAVRGLGHVVDETVVPALVARLGDDDAGVRTEAVVALESAGSYDVLQGHEGDPSFHVRAALATALGAAGSPASLARLDALANDTSVTVQAAAIRARVRRSPAVAPDRLTAWLSNKDWRIRAAAAAVATEAFDDPDTRVQAAVLAGLTGALTGDAIVTAAIARDDLAVRGTAVGLVAEREHLDRVALLTSAYDESPGETWIEVRESIVDALAGLEEARGLLERALRTDDAPSVRGKAAAALGTAAPTVNSPPPLSRWIGHPRSAGAQVDLETRHGVLRIGVFSEQAPVHAAAFLDRVDAGFYDGLTWHRVVSNFVIQGGDPRGDGWGSDGENLRDEINSERYGRGAVGMPKAGKDTGSCQLFITHVPTPHLDGNYTVFGQVISGHAVIDAIEVGDAILGIQRVR